MKLGTAIGALMTLAVVATFADAAARVSIRVSSVRTSYRSYSYRSYSYRTYTYVPSVPYYTRRLSVAVMGPVYYGYASRYPNYFSYRRADTGASGETCKNYLALSNGSFIGSFQCPFLPDEPSNWTRCCGYANEEFCCDPSYDDSWSNVNLSVGAIVGIVIGCLTALCFFIILITCCCIKRLAVQSEKASAEQNKPFVDSQGGRSQAEAAGGPVPPPYPTMEYGTIPVQPQAGAGQAPLYPPPYPTPYGNSH